MFLKYLLSFISLFILVASRAQGDEYASDPNIFELTPSTFDKVVHKSNYTTLVKFYAPWCGYCQQLQPIYHKLGKYIQKDAKYSVNIASVNCDKDYNKALCSQYQVRGFPTLMVFRPPKYGTGKEVKAQNHASEVYQGERTVKSMTKFLSSRLKNYVKKFHNVKSDGLGQWLESDQPSILLISQANSVSPLLKSLAIDFLGRVNIGMIGKLNNEPHTITVDGNEIEVPATFKSTLLYFNKEKGKFLGRAFV
ncbi:putative thioredoxin [Candida maltosa Xu316]|uniref:Putative thioredoxin n=1 Tax=Candida maltosa (strain Xu316) TaxID=1245528 RepID=M3J3Q3_CANMX|nr:putative thioredoxin [Candida maltosa Xu316]